MKFKESRKDLRFKTEERLKKIQSKNSLKSHKKSSKLSNVNPKKRIKSVKPEIQPATVEELNRFHETETLYNSNLFRLQIEALLKSIKTNTNNSNLESLENFINNELNDNAHEISMCDAYKTHVSKIMPILPENKTDSNVKFKFYKPDNPCTVINLRHESNEMLKYLILLTMPTNFFREKDYLNQRYMYRKAFFLGYIYEQLKSKFPEWKLSICYRKQNPYLPFIKVIIDQSNEFNVFAVLNVNQFPEKRLSINSSNIRTDYVFECNSDNSMQQYYATPFYNSVLKYDMMKMKRWNEFECLVKDLPPQLFNGLRLFIIWIWQRGLGNSYGGLDLEDAAFLFMELFRLRVFNKLMSSYQVFRHLVNWISNDGNICEYVEDLEVNVAVRLKKQATRALELLDRADHDAFRVLFVEKIEFYQNFDAILTIRYSKKLEKLVTSYLEVAKLVSFMHFYKPLVVDHMIAIMKFALTDRVTEIVPFMAYDNVIVFGLRLNTNSVAFQTLNLGPETNLAESHKFREFWGNLSEIRRFKDTKIRECVYWKVTTMNQKRAIFKQIINFVLLKKFNLNTSDFKIIANQADSMIRNNYSEQDELCMNAIITFDRLYSILRQLKTSLDISGVQVSSSVFSYSDVYPETAYVHQESIVEIPGNNYKIFSEKSDSVPSYIGAIEVILQYSRHSQWPDDFQAIEYIKQSLLLEIKDLLKNHNNIESMIKSNYLDVYFKGLVFRLRIFQAKSIALLKKNDSSPSSIACEMEIKESILPKVRSAIKGIRSQNSSYGYSTALIKRWFRALLLDHTHISDELLDILNAKLYLTDNEEKKQLPQIAFIEFLKYYALQLDASIRPVIVNFGNLLDNNQIKDIELDFIKNRHEYPALFVVTPFEVQFKNIAFAFKLSPTLEVLQWSKQLALQALNVIENRIYSLQFFNIKTIFTPNLSGYDVLLRLNSKYISRRIKIDKDIMTEALRIKNESLPVIEFDPVQMYLNELRTNYGQFALFFHDTYDGTVIGVLWRPITKLIKKFKGNDFEGRKPIRGVLLTDMETNFDAIVNDFVVLGGNLIESVDKK